MLVQIDVSGDDLQKRDGEFEPTTFKGLNLKEAHVEEFIRNNIEVLFAPGDTQEAGGESLLIVGQQVTDIQGKRSDLTAVDGSGYLTLIEVKRDIQDSAARKEPLEFQAIRYAASLATIKTPDQLVELVYAPYVEVYRKKGEFAGFENLTSDEIARKKLIEFLEENNALATFNQKQRIVLAASEFETQTLSAVAWLIANQVDISCFQLTPGKLLGKYFLDVKKILPPPMLENSYVNLRQRSSQTAGRTATSGARRASATYGRQNLPRIADLLHAGLLKSGDVLTIRGAQNSRAVVVSSSQVDFGGKRLSYNQWGQQLKDWSSIRIYDWAVQKRSGKTLGELREELLDISEGLSDAGDPAERETDAGEDSSIPSDSSDTRPDAL